MVTGRANQVTTLMGVARYRTLLLPWGDRRMDQIVHIQAELVAGCRSVLFHEVSCSAPQQPGQWCPAPEYGLWIDRRGGRPPRS